MKHRHLGMRFVLAAMLVILLAGLAPSAALAQTNLGAAELANRGVVNAPALQPATHISAASIIYVVKRGDTLARIAARYGVSVAAILRANPAIRNPDRIYIGQRIVIPTGSTGNPGTPGGVTFSQVSIYLIAPETGGSVGCGDSAVAVKRNITPTRAPLTAALNQLLSLHSQWYGQSGYYNALWQSNLSLQKITQSGSTYNIYLVGQLQLGGTCDNPRVEAQLMRTARQFSTVQQANFFINGVPLSQALSLRGS